MAMMEMIAITIITSIREKPDCRFLKFIIGNLQYSSNYRTRLKCLRPLLASKKNLLTAPKPYLLRIQLKAQS